MEDAQTTIEEERDEHKQQRKELQAQEEGVGTDWQDLQKSLHMSNALSFPLSTLLLSR